MRQALATKPDGSVDEDKIADADKRGEIDDVAGRSQKSGDFDLAPGTYIVLCNTVDEKAPTGKSASHFMNGMYTTITVS